MSNTLRKAERFHSHKLIEKLFAEGKVWIKYPFRIVWMPLEEPKGPPAEVMISVSKKKFKRANKRNLLRRRTKEAYRQQKDKLYEFLELHHKRIAFAIIYLPAEELLYADIEKGMKKMLSKMIEELTSSFDEQQSE